MTCGIGTAAAREEEEGGQGETGTGLAAVTGSLRGPFRTLVRQEEREQKARGARPRPTRHLSWLAVFFFLSPWGAISSSFKGGRHTGMT